MGLILNTSALIEWECAQAAGKLVDLLVGARDECLFLDMKRNLVTIDRPVVSRSTSRFGAVARPSRKRP